MLRSNCQYNLLKYKHEIIVLTEEKSRMSFS